MLFYLTSLNLAEFLKGIVLTIQEVENNHEAIIVLDACKHSDFFCKKYILNGLDKTLYEVYSWKGSAKCLRDLLEKKYDIKDARIKKLILEKILEYKMVDSKTMISQVQGLQVLHHDIHT